MNELQLMGIGLLVTAGLIVIIKLVFWLRLRTFIPKQYVHSLELMLNKMQVQIDELEEELAAYQTPKTVKLRHTIYNPNTGEDENWLQVFAPGEFEYYQAGLVLVRRGKREVWLEEKDLRSTDIELDPFTWERVS